MEQGLLTEISRRDGLQYQQVPLKLLEPYDGDALSYSENGYWNRQFLTDWRYVEDGRRTGGFTDSAFSFEFRVR
jgi:hypothetical protein